MMESNAGKFTLTATNDVTLDTLQDLFKAVAAGDLVVTETCEACGEGGTAMRYDDEGVAICSTCWDDDDLWG